MATRGEVSTQTLSAAEWLALVRAVFNNGEFFRAFDLAQAGLRAHPGDLLLAHRAVLSLANSGAVEMAGAELVRLGLDKLHTVEMLSLRGRLAKDRGFGCVGAARAAAFAEASDFYEQAYAKALRSGSAEPYYPAINAASLALLAGNVPEAARRGQEVLDLLGPRIEAACAGRSRDAYWVLATAIEARLLVGDVAGAQALTGPAVAEARHNQADLSSTWRQLERVLAARALPKDALSSLAPQEVVHFLGHIISPAGEPGRFPAAQEAEVTADIEQQLDQLNVGAAYGALAAGADILLAEALLRRGAAVHVVLPFARDDFEALSVRPAGAGWVARFEACLERASSVRFATEDKHLGDDHLFAYGSQLAMGLAVLYARHLHAGLRQIAVWDGETSESAAGTTVDMRAWQRAGLPQTTIPCGRRSLPESPMIAPRPMVAGRRHSRAMLFGDVCGFSQLTDEQLPHFTSQVMAPLGRVIARYAGHTDMVNTWGDGIFVVFGDAGLAARCALEMQEAMGAIDFAASGLPDNITLRLGGHLGPVYELMDPILNRRNFYGAQVSRAARIEPIVPGGCVYLTETFAAVLALSNADSLACDYVGWTDMAKKYGRLRMFLLRRRDGRLEPTVLSDIERAPVSV